MRDFPAGIRSVASAQTEATAANLARAALNLYDPDTDTWSPIDASPQPAAGTGRGLGHRHRDIRDPLPALCGPHQLPVNPREVVQLGRQHLLQRVRECDLLRS